MPDSVAEVALKARLGGRLLLEMAQVKVPLLALNDCEKGLPAVAERETLDGGETTMEKS